MHGKCLPPIEVYIEVHTLEKSRGENEKNRAAAKQTQSRQREVQLCIWFLFWLYLVKKRLFLVRVSGDDH